MYDLFEQVGGTKERMQRRLRFGGCDKNDTRRIRCKFVSRGGREDRQEDLAKMSCTEGVSMLDVAR